MAGYIRYFITPSGRSPVLDFLKDLYKKDKNRYRKIQESIIYLDEYGIDDDCPGELKKMDSDLWEVKKDNIRILFTMKKGEIIILVHGFIKKSQKTPLKDIQLAKKRIKMLSDMG